MTLSLTAQQQNAQLFSTLHQRGNPLLLLNAWDAGSAKAVAQGGAKAIASGSWSVAAAHGYDDGEKLPLQLALDNIDRMVRAVTLPVSLDFESGYSVDLATLRTNIALVIRCGVVGINFEDCDPVTGAMFSIQQQSERIAAIRHVAQTLDVPLFINARTDIFLNEDISKHSLSHLKEVIARAHAYAAAGANGLFVPGLCDLSMIKSLCQDSPLPVNILMMPPLHDVAVVASLGVARISYGPSPYRQAMEALKQTATHVYGVSKTQ